MNIRYRVAPVLHRLPARLSRRALFMLWNGSIPNLRDPATFNEKINWRILNDRRPIMEWTCDKLAMKEYAAKVPGLRIPKTLWYGTDVRELGDKELPAHWVFKPNHRTGQVFFGRSRPDIPTLARLATEWLPAREAERLHEWAYSKARRLFLVEETLGVPGSPPSDYKFFVFSGHVAVVQVDTDRHTQHHRRLYLPNWSPLEVKLGPYPFPPVAPPPANLDKMLAMVSELGSPFDFIRVDLYNIDGDVVFGELTPYCNSGLDRFVPASFDAELGARWELPHVGPEAR